MAKDQFSTGDVMKMLNISRMALRYYMRKGLVSGTKDEENGYHYFDEHDLVDLKDITHLRQTLDFSVEEIRDYLYSESLNDYRHLVKNRMASLNEEIAEKQRQLRALKNWWGLLDELDTYGGSFDVVDYELTYLVLKFPLSEQENYWKSYYDPLIGKEIIAPFRIYHLEEDDFVWRELGFYCAVDSNIRELLKGVNFTEEILKPGRYLYGLLRGKGLPYEDDIFRPVREYVEENHIKVAPYAYASVYHIDRKGKEREYVYDMMLPVTEE